MATATSTPNRSDVLDNTENYLLKNAPNKTYAKTLKKFIELQVLAGSDLTPLGEKCAAKLTAQLAKMIEA